MPRSPFTADPSTAYSQWMTQYTKMPRAPLFILHRLNHQDVLATIGVFAPALPTPLTEEHFTVEMLEHLTAPVPLPTPKLTTQRLTSLPLELNNAESEFNLVAKPSSLSSDHPPLQLNRESPVQKEQNVSADRPDFIAKYRNQEILWIGATGHAQQRNLAKNNWELFRLARFGKYSLVCGLPYAPVVQVVHDRAVYYSLSVPIRGIYLTKRIGAFTMLRSIP
ncbi:hypothetical protein BGW39_010941 [Mortierella sp. 14UC]|nr:hypothetical protein BGW39_010941 [Mortierella sp. 14UC]